MVRVSRIDWKDHASVTRASRVRRSAQRRNIATEFGERDAPLCFGALGMCRVGLTHSKGNEASRRIAEKLGFVPIESSGRPTHCPAGSWPTDSAMRGLVQSAAPFGRTLGQGVNSALNGLRGSNCC